MRSWRDLLGGPILWAAHFFAVYGIASIWPGTQTAIVLVLVVSALALAAASWLFARAISRLREASDELQRWSSGLAILGCAIAAAAIIYQGLPAVLT
ncbi:MAG TPA: hypothetical protein VFT07_07920 [Sphingomicrobium sp.]|nr:hypothetical protein [Sphingomicrobium sp.]